MNTVNLLLKEKQQKVRKREHEPPILEEILDEEEELMGKKSRVSGLLSNAFAGLLSYTAPPFKWADIMKAAYTRDAEGFWPKLLLRLHHNEGVIKGFEKSMDWIGDYAKEDDQYLSEEGTYTLPRVVEFGYGNGFPAVEIVKRKIAERVDCFDISDASIDSTKEYIKKRGVEDGKIFLTKADVSRSIDSIEGDSIDAVRCVGVLEYMNEDERTGTLSNAKRILKRGGQFLVGATSTPTYWQKEPVWMNRLEAWFFDHLMKANNSFVDRFDPEEKELDNLLGDYGFKVERRTLVGPYYMVWATKV
jgi:ubiquinone/menaquinone biosynthesis C-methylase UbiE